MKVCPGVRTSFQPRGAPECAGGLIWFNQNLKQACLNEINKCSPIVECNNS